MKDIFYLGSVSCRKEISHSFHEDEHMHQILRQVLWYFAEKDYPDGSYAKEKMCHIIYLLIVKIINNFKNIDVDLIKDAFVEPQAAENLMMKVLEDMNLIYKKYITQIEE